jgi:hypothetical protein
VICEKNDSLGRASQFFITTEDAEDTENGHFMGNYGVFSVSSASSVVKNILLIVSVTYQKHCDALLAGFIDGCPTAVHKDLMTLE